MTSLTAIFGRSREETRGSDKLLELYWNRAELKKEFANLRNETFRLKDRIREQQAQAARAQQQLLQIENLLLDPEWAYTAVTHYQLRALNAHLESKLARFAEQLKQQREQRQHRQLLAAWQDRQDTDAADVEAELAAARDSMRHADQSLAAIRERFDAMHRLLRFFRKRHTQRELDRLAATIETAQLRERELEGRLASIRGEAAPDVQGLDVAAKRTINCMILAFAHQVYLHYREDDIASLARDAAARSAGACRYGSRNDCDALLSRVLALRSSMPRTADLADALQRRARFIAERVRFKGDDEAIPDPLSTPSVFELRDDGGVREIDANLLGDNYWNLNGLLSR